MTTKDAIQKIFEKKMSDAKDLIDEALNQKLAQYLSDIHEAKLDPVGKEDGDIDNDGDEDDTDSYLLNRRKKIGQAMKKEDVDHIEEGAPDTELDHHKGKSPNVYEDDYLPKKKTGVAHKAVRNTGAEGY
tara:strand:- start:704 stop:1093 length:390 start_codon:yes stop_codon:yes gene_type:complete